MFSDSNDTERPLTNGRVDAIVTDLPTAVFIPAAQVAGSKRVLRRLTDSGRLWASAAPPRRYPRS